MHCTDGVFNNLGRSETYIFVRNIGVTELDRANELLTGLAAEYKASGLGPR